MLSWNAPSAPGSLKLVWFKTLKLSARNSSFARSVILKFLNRDGFQEAKPGPENVLRPKLPGLPGAGAWNTQLLAPKQKSPPQPFAHMSWVALPKLAMLEFGRSFASKSRLKSQTLRGPWQNGSQWAPVWYDIVPLNCHPPSATPRKPP